MCRIQSLPISSLFVCPADVSCLSRSRLDLFAAKGAAAITLAAALRLFDVEWFGFGLPWTLRALRIAVENRPEKKKWKIVYLEYPFCDRRISTVSCGR